MKLLSHRPFSSSSFGRGERCMVIILSSYFLLTLSRSEVQQGHPQLQHFTPPSTVQFLGVFTRSSSAASVGASLAVDDINAHNVRTNLPFRVNLVEETGVGGGGETHCGAMEDPVTLMSRLLSAAMSSASPPFTPITTKPIILAGCHSDCVLLAQAESDAITMCYGLRSSVTRMDDVTTSEMFMMQPDLCTLIIPLTKLVLQFGWRKVAVISFGGDPLGYLAELVGSVLEEHGVRVGRLDGRASFGLVQQRNFRIVVVVGGEVMGREILCAIYKAAMFNNYVWIFIGPSGKEWVVQGEHGAIPGSCRVDQLVAAAEGHLVLSPMMWHPNPNLRTVSNRTAASFRREVVRRLGGQLRMMDFDEAPLAYDAVWAAYIGVASSLLECGGTTCPIQMDDSLNGVMFPGVSGNVSFRDGRRSVTGVTLRVEQFKNGRYEEVAFHFNGNNSWSWVRQSIFGSEVPGDGFDVGDTFFPDIPFPPSLTPPEPPERSSANTPLAPPARFGIATFFYPLSIISQHYILYCIIST
ncbi:gamma-aminobutyric acid type B receptor subunit 1 [Folsomia candida]|uniref:Gamma-aminobutyric acid type B receptor subunit 1 n=1 Tax=Folsomia candida TaxID=158441 RepID=A0A226F396_FOLCA|nr:gamma-aminobutyric acid type B receptor subunit 1 [Folsomia candida]OXA63917.1 Gamma-aminobutyric acid type B receptor subunit 1 [Folsomia candida]